MARHVEQLRALEGTWAFARLEIDGSTIPASALEASRILIDGDRFRTESPEATYEGIFNINVEAQPHEIDIEFVAGPEAGNWNFGIFRLDGDQLEICLDMNGKPRPTEFRTSPGSGHAYETLKRSLPSTPRERNGRHRIARAPPSPPAQECVGFDFVESADAREASRRMDARENRPRRTGTSANDARAPAFARPTRTRSRSRSAVKR